MAAASPAPDLLPVDVTALLSGRLHWQPGFFHEAVAWTLRVGLPVCAILAVTWVLMRLYGASVSRVFSLFEAKLPPASAARLSLRAGTLAGILRSLGRAVIGFLGLMIALSKLGVNVAPLLASAGIVGLAVGFGAQSLVKDVISGFFVLVEDQYGVGDTVEIGAHTGVVERMNLRITQIRTVSGQLVTIPNGTLTTVINHSKDWSRSILEIGVAYDTDPDLAERVIEAAAEAVRGAMPEVVLERPELLGIDAFKDAEAVYKLFFKTRPGSQWAVGRAFRRELWLRLRQAGVEQFAQRHLWVSQLPGSADEPSGGAGR